ncbi:unnamed protein product [Durusdinium trenchii]|uniref:Uncharacterized protein n=1 Tax=Durusdinium trenchii TaxID=1381693 RepID=A0ABP0KI39_9DINO
MDAWRRGAAALARRLTAPDAARPQSLGALGLRSFAVWGFPPRLVTPNFGGPHMHPNRLRGYPNPIKRNPDKVRRLPNVKLKRFDYSLTTSADGLFYLRPPYPPRINRTIECEPPGKAKKNPWPTTVHKDYKLKWKNIEYIFVPELTRKPHGTPQRRWTGPVTRVEHREGKAKVTMVTHDARLLDW